MKTCCVTILGARIGVALIGQGAYKLGMEKHVKSDNMARDLCRALYGASINMKFR